MYKNMQQLIKHVEQYKQTYENLTRTYKYHIKKLQTHTKTYDYIQNSIKAPERPETKPP